MGVMYACNEGCLCVTCAASVSHITLSVTLHDTTNLLGVLSIN